MIEPIYVSQTFEPDHTRTPEASRAWFKQCEVEAKAAGGKHARYSITDENDGLLFECWDEKIPPSEEGSPRWAFEKRTREPHSPAS